MLDLEPESAIALGHFEEGRIVRSAARISTHLYARARMLFVFSEGARAILTQRRGVDPARVRVLTGGVDTQLFRPKDPDPVRARKLGCEGSLVVMYTGTFGRLQHLGTMLEAVQMLRAQAASSSSWWATAKSAPSSKRCAGSSRSRNMCPYVPPRPTEEVPDLLALADVCVTNVRRAEFHDGIVPAKLLEYLACGKAIVAGIGGESRRILENEGAGIAVPPRMRALAAAVSELRRPGAPRAHGGRGSPSRRGALLARARRSDLAGGTAPGGSFVVTPAVSSWRPAVWCPHGHDERDDRRSRELVPGDRAAFLGRPGATARDWHVPTAATLRAHRNACHLLRAGRQRGCIPPTDPRGGCRGHEVGVHGYSQNSSIA